MDLAGPYLKVSWVEAQIRLNAQVVLEKFSPCTSRIWYRKDQDPETDTLCTNECVRVYVYIICIYVYIYIHTCARMCAYIYLLTCLRTYVRKHIHTCVRTYKHDIQLPTHRETARQTDRLTETQTDKHRQTDRQTDRQCGYIHIYTYI